MLEVALGNLRASGAKTLIVGSILTAGALFVVLGGALIDGIDAGMRQSIQGSLAGHIQVYNSHSRDKVSLYGELSGGGELVPLDDFAPIKRLLLELGNVKAVVPLARGDAVIDTPNALDRVLSRLRASVRRSLAGERSATLAAELVGQKAHTRRIVTEMAGSQGVARTLVDELRVQQNDWQALRTASSDAFWTHFDADPLAALELLENRVASQSVDGTHTFLRYAATDFAAFRRAFDGLRVVEGTMVPPGMQGVLLPRLLMDTSLRLRAARRLDQIKVALASGRRIAKDKELQRLVRENVAQTRELYEQLDGPSEQLVVTRLQAALAAETSNVAQLLALLLDTRDETFAAHDAIFARDVAPLLELSRIRVGDTVTLKGFGQAVFVRTVPVKVYGTYEFAGLEQSNLAGQMWLVDLVTFRQLRGFPTVEAAREAAALERSAGARDIGRGDAEAALFGGGAALEAHGASQALDEAKLLGREGTDDAAAPRSSGRPHTQDEIEHGAVLSVAVVLDDEARLEETRLAIEALAKERGLPLAAITWQQAAGLVGEFVGFARFVLWLAVVIIFAIALILINNATVMAALKRMSEIGTLRALGARRRYVFDLLLIESMMLGLCCGVLGALLGLASVLALRFAGGVPAASTELHFFFAGPRLMPVPSVRGLLVGLAVVLVVSLLSGLYPALLGSRVTPLTAMQDRES